MTIEEKLDILEKKYLEEFGHEMDQWQKEHLMMFLDDDPKNMESQYATHYNSLAGQRNA